MKIAVVEKVVGDISWLIDRLIYKKIKRSVHMSAYSLLNANENYDAIIVTNFDVPYMTVDEILGHETDTQQPEVDSQLNKAYQFLGYMIRELRSRNNTTPVYLLIHSSSDEDLERTADILMQKYNNVDKIYTSQQNSLSDNPTKQALLGAIVKGSECAIS